jgi:hypothetical protein
MKYTIKDQYELQIAQNNTSDAKWHRNDNWLIENQLIAGFFLLFHISDTDYLYYA